MYPSTLLADPSPRSAGVVPRAPAAEPQGRARKEEDAVRRPERRSGPRRRLRWSWLAIAAVIALTVGGLFSLLVWPPLATVMSASMSPTIKTGDIVALKKLERPARVGDIVAVSVPEDIRARYGYPPVVIHRVVEIDADDVVTTKGDAHKEADPFDVPRSALTTKVVATMPAAGRALAFLGSGHGLLWLAGGALLFVGMPLLERRRESRRRELRAANVAAAETLRAVTASFTECVEAANRRTEAAEEQLRAHLEQLPAQIERAVALALADHVPAPPPPPPAPARSGRLVAA